jgi:hypothetical protein
VNLPSDLKAYRADDAFQLLSQEVTEYALCAILFSCWLADRFAWLT